MKMANLNNSIKYNPGNDNRLKNSNFLPKNENRVDTSENLRRKHIAMANRIAEPPNQSKKYNPLGMNSAPEKNVRYNNLPTNSQGIPEKNMHYKPLATNSQGMQEKNVRYNPLVSSSQDIPHKNVRYNPLSTSSQGVPERHVPYNPLATSSQGVQKASQSILLSKLKNSFEPPRHNRERYEAYPEKQRGPVQNPNTTKPAISEKDKKQKGKPMKPSEDPDNIYCMRCSKYHNKDLHMQGKGTVFDNKNAPESRTTNQPNRSYNPMEMSHSNPRPNRDYNDQHLRKRKVPPQENQPEGFKQYDEYSDEDSFADLDGFIDDETYGDDSDQNYKSELRKVTGYDPTAFDPLKEMQDDRMMEVRDFGTLQMEESYSRRIARQEDDQEEILHYQMNKKDRR